jgi:hypothetical protein
VSIDYVIFGIEGKRVRTQFDRALLRLGSVVYVQSILDNEPQVLAQISEGAIPYSVRWISPSEWYVALTRGFALPSEFAQRVQDAIGNYISRAEIDTSLKDLAARVRMEHFYKTSELDRNPLSVISTVLGRLDLCSRLNQPEMQKLLFAHHEPLISYLYLTCFDRLGQPADRVDFGTWLTSSRHDAERRLAINGMPAGTDILAGTRLLHSYYTSLYGVKSSFFRFLHELLPPAVHRELLGSVTIERLTNPPKLETLPSADDNEKEKYLFKRRNDYTHKAAFTPTNERLGRAYGSPAQEFHADHWTSTSTRGWPDTLDRVVRVGLARYLLAETGK